MKYVAILLLAVINANLGHVLADGMDCNDSHSGGQTGFMLIINDTDKTDGHPHDHGTFCDQWLCIGFSGVALGNEIALPTNLQIKSVPFTDGMDRNFHSRTSEPTLPPPKLT